MDDGAGFNRDRLGGALGGVALHGRCCFGDLELHLDGDIDVDDFFVEEYRIVFLLGFEEFDAGTDEVGGKREAIAGVARVVEHVLACFFVAKNEYDGLCFKLCFLDTLVLVETVLNHFAALEALKFGDIHRLPLLNAKDVVGEHLAGLVVKDNDGAGGYFVVG